MSYVIWHGGDCTIFASNREKAAMEYIHKAIEEFPFITFNRWEHSQSGQNLVTILSDFDEAYQIEKRPKYLIPRKEQS